MSLVIVVEGDTDRPMAEKLARDAGFDISYIDDRAGKSQIDARWSGFNSAARVMPWFVLRDLDRDAPCAPALLAARSWQPAEWMVTRLAVREGESWLLADTEGFSRFLHVPEQRFPLDPDSEEKPKTTVVNLARQSTRAEIRKGLVPKEGASARVGPLFEAKIIEFAKHHWSLERACRRSDSLRRARAALRELAARWHKRH
jgi:hypothetical protein